jgi:hypothetical protein
MGIMPTKEEIQKVMDWCEKTKAERMRPYTIERNPFKDEMAWMRRFPLIEIDRPMQEASRNSMVYDSRLKQLWQFMNGNWRRIEPDMRIE